jgi:hypothetical protein
LRFLTVRTIYVSMFYLQRTNRPNKSLQPTPNSAASELVRERPGDVLKREFAEIVDSSGQQRPENEVDKCKQNKVKRLS